MRTRITVTNADGKKLLEMDLDADVKLEAHELTQLIADEYGVAYCESCNTWRDLPDVDINDEDEMICGRCRMAAAK